jgi:hypothetical protein
MRHNTKAKLVRKILLSNDAYNTPSRILTHPFLECYDPNGVFLGSIKRTFQTLVITIYITTSQSQ